MVRETRHLWVGNLPENIREDRIREHFKRYGRVQSVKLLPRLKDDDGSTGLCATVAFMDIKSASKAHNMEHKLDERCLSTEYYEPAAIPGGSAAPLYTPRFPHGPPEDHASFERSSHFYERRDGDAYLRRPAAAYHVTDPLRGRARDRLYRNGPYTPLLERCEVQQRTALTNIMLYTAQPTHHRSLVNAWGYEGSPSVRYPPVAPVPDSYTEERREMPPIIHKKRPKSSRSGSESGSNSGSSRSRSRSRSRSHSSSSSSQSGSSTCSSATSSPVTDKSCSPHSSHHGTMRSGRMGGVSLQSTVSAAHTNNVSPAVHSDDRRPLAICVRNLPIRSSDTSLKDGLFHEYKKHGKVVSVKVVGQAGDRYAIVCFKKPEDAEKALEESQDKLFFGCKIEVAPYQGYDVDDNEFRPYEAEQDEYHPKATRTLFIGNLEKDITASELRKHFEQFGEIIEIDIKKQGALSSYAFCQFADISSVVKAMRTMDGEHLGNNRIKLGFGKSMPTNCVWVDGIAENVPEKYLNAHFHTFGTISHITIDRDRGHALIYFEQVACAQEAVREMRGFMLRGRKLQVDFASRECQEAFYEHLEKQGHAIAGGERPWERYDTNCSTREVQAGRFETTVVVPGNSRFTRYETPQRSRTASYSRSSNSSGSTPVAPVSSVPSQNRSSSRSQRTGQRYEYYDSEYPERRYRNYDEFSQGSGASHDDSYEQELRDYGYCQRERGDSSPSPITCESEGMRRSVAVVNRPVRSEKSSSPCEKVEDEAFKRHVLQSVVVSDPTPLQQPPPPLPPPPSVPQHPPDIHHLQKERVHIQHLLEQLDDCTSSADEDSSVPSLVPKKRIKLTVDESSGRLCGSENCFESMNHGDSVSATSLIVTTHNHRKSLSDVRRMSDTSSSKHCSRRLSTDSLSKHGSGSRDVRETSADRLVQQVSYSPHPVCKRRKTGSSTSESEDRTSCRSGKHSHHHHHHHNDVGSSLTTISGSDSVDGSRPGTPLCDERPENLSPPSEPRRIPRERGATEGPLSLPLPRFAAQVLSSTPRLSVSISGASSKAVPSTSIVGSPPSVVTSPRPVSHSQSVLHQPPSPSPAPPPASPPPRPPSLSSSSSDSEICPPSPSLEERIRSLDEKYEKWSGSRAKSAAGGEALAKLDASERYRFRHKLLDANIDEVAPSDIVKSVLAKRSVFDEDSKRLENFNEKYEPREFIPYTRTPSCFQTLRVKTDCVTGQNFSQCGTSAKSALSPSPLGTPTTPAVVGKLGTFPTSTTTSQLPPRLMGTLSPLHSPSQALPKSPFSTGTPTVPSPAIKPPLPLSPVVGVSPLIPQCSKLQTMPKTSSTLSPRSSGTGLPAAKGLQYPFPSHPPVLPTTTVATTTATNANTLVSVSSVGVKPSLSVTVPTTATVTVLSPEVSRTCVKPLGTSSATTSVIHSLEVSRPSVVRSVSSLTVSTTTTCTKPSPEVTPPVPSSKVSSPGVLRLSFAKPTVTNVTMDSAVGSVLSPEILRSPPSGVKCSNIPLSVSQVTSRLSTSPQATSRMSVTTTAKMATGGSSVTSVLCGTVQSAKLAKPVEPSAKVQTVATVISRPSSNIPSIMSPPSESVIIPTCIASTVTTVAAASTVTTTVVTVTMASTGVTSVTSTTSTTIATAVVTNSGLDGVKNTGKTKPCGAVKKETSLPALGSKEKQNDIKLVSTTKKDSLPSPTTVSSPVKKEIGFSQREKKEVTGVVCTRRSSEREVETPDKKRDRSESLEDKRRESVDSIDRKKEKDISECPDRERRRSTQSLDEDKERKKDTTEIIDKENRKEEEREQRKDSVESMEGRKEPPDFEEKERWKENVVIENDKDQWKDTEDVQEKEKRKDVIIDGQKEMDIDKELRKDKKKDRTSSNSSPASIGCKRRMSSQDSVDSGPDDAKRLKLSPAVSIEHRKVPERRDSKDSGRSSSSSKRSSSEKRHNEKNFSKVVDDKTREERKPVKDEKREKEIKPQDGLEKQKGKDKQKKKTKTEKDSPKDQKEPSLKPIKDTSVDKDISPTVVKKKEDSETEDKEEKPKNQKKETKEKKKQLKEEAANVKQPVKEEIVLVESTEEKRKNVKKEREKRNSSERKKEENPAKEEQKPTGPKSKNAKKECSHSDTDSEDGGCDGPKKHSIFDIVDDGPAYISMYDKVKARSTKNMQKQEEEKRQEKMREKFNLLKQSRAKREEKKRSTSWDEDSDSDNPDRERKANKRLTKLMISSSSEDDGRIRTTTYETEDIKIGKCRPLVRLKKEDICLGENELDTHHLNKMTGGIKETKPLENVEDEDDGNHSKHTTSITRKGNRTKLVSDTSEDDSAAVTRFKSNVPKSLDVYSADSEVDVDYADSDDKHSHGKKHNLKNSKINKIDLLDDINTKKIPEGTKVGLEKQAALKKITAKNKVLVSSDDETVKKLPCDPVNSGDDKQAIFRKSIAKSKACKIVLDTSDDDNARKLMAESLKVNTFGDDKSITFKKFSNKNKLKPSVDSSDDDSARKNMTDSIKSDTYEENINPDIKKPFNKSKILKLFPNSEEVSKPFPIHDEKDELFDEENVPEKNDSLTKLESSGIENISDAEGPASTPPLLEKSVFYSNPVTLGKVNDSSRKKSHKKKQKRQKNMHNVDDEKITDDLDSEAFEKSLTEEGVVEDAKLKVEGERKKHKRDKRKSSYGKSSDGDGKPSKPRKKKSGKPELGVLKVETNLKREEKMEDIFGPLSDDSSHGNSEQMFEKIPDKWQVSMVYGSDSDSNVDHSLLNSNQEGYSPDNAIHARSAEKERKRKEKKRRERKAREEESVTVDLAEAGRVLEAKLMDEDYADDGSQRTKDDDESEKQEPTPTDTDVFRFTDGDEGLESGTVVVEKTKEKKKKRKKSKEEKQNRREHHHHHHHDKSSSKSSPERRLSITEETKLPSPSLPSLEIPLVSSPNGSPTEGHASPLQSLDPVVSPTANKASEKKKPEKFIPGFGSEIDDTIHETAVKSISEFEAPKPETAKTEEPVKTEELLLPKPDGEDLAGDEEKPRAVISQEETEDAVKALLGESFGRGFECYPGEGNAAGNNPPESQLPTDEEDETRKAVEGLIDMKPETPQSEHELQIDTDTEDNVDDNYQYNATSEEQIPNASNSNEFSARGKSEERPAFYADDQLPSLKTYESSAPAKPAIEPPEVTVPVCNETDSKEETAIKDDPQDSLAEKVVDQRMKSTEKEISQSPEPVPDAELPGLSSSDETKVESAEESEVNVEDVKENEPKANEQIPAVETSVEPATEEDPTVQKEVVKDEEITDKLSLPVLDVDQPSVKDEEVGEEPLPETQNKIKIEDPLPAENISPVGVHDEPEAEAKEPVPLEMDETSNAIAPIANGDEAATSENPPDSQLTKSEVQLETECELPSGVSKNDNNAEIIFPSLQKVDSLNDVRESEFSEPEPDMKTDIVSSLLESESLKRELPEGSRPVFSGDAENSYDLLKEHNNKEVTSVIKENDSFSPSQTCDPEMKSVAEDVEDEFMSSPKSESNDTVKGDSIFWSTKEVNIDSVIKKVDALCSVEETSADEEQQPRLVDNEKHWLSPLKEKEVLPPIHADKKRWLSPLKENEESKMWLAPLTEKEVSNENKSWLSPLKEKELGSSVTKDDGKIWLNSLTEMEVSSVNKEKGWSSPLKENAIKSVTDSESKVWTGPLKEYEPSEVEIKPWSLPLQENKVPTIGNENEVPVIEEGIATLGSNDKLSETSPEKEVLDREDKPHPKPCEENEIAPVTEVQASPTEPKISPTETKMSAKEAKRLAKEAKRSATEAELSATEAEISALQAEMIVTEAKLLNSLPQEAICKPEEEEEEEEEESVGAAKVEKVGKEISSSTEQENNIATSQTSEEQDEHRMTSVSSLDDHDAVAVPASSPEGTELDRETQCQSVATPRTSRRGRRGAGGRRKVAARTATGVTTRRTRLTTGGAKSPPDIMNTPVSPRRGGRSARGGKVTHENLSQISKKLSTDVYEFHDDSEDETANTGDKGRPRLILTIKSPVSTSSVSSSLGKDLNNPIKPPTSPIPPPIVETREEFPSHSVPTLVSANMSASTRKSRRLLERDGCRSTVDDVIEDVVRGTIVTRSAAAAAAAAAGQSVSPRRSTRQNNPGPRQITTIFPEPRKSPRGGKKGQTATRLPDDLADDIKKLEEEEEEEEEKEGEELTPSPPLADTAGKEMSPEKSIASLPSGSATVKVQSPPASPTPPPPPPPPPLPPPSSPPSTKETAESEREPMTLIDPVTGLLIPMRECEEGQYIPVTTTVVDVPPAKTVVTSTTTSSEPPVEKSSESTSEVSPVLTSVPAKVVQPVPVTSESAPPWIPKTLVPTSTSVVRPVTVPPTTLPAKTTVVTRTVTTLKHHVLLASKPPPSVVTTTQSTSVKTHPAPAVQPIIPSVVTTASPALVVSKSIVPINPKAHLLQAAAAPSAVVTATSTPVTSSVSKAVNLQHPATLASTKAISAAAPINPKVHLLQAASKVSASAAVYAKTSPLQGPGRPPSPPAPKPHLMALAASKVPVPSPPLSQPPKAHHGLAQQPILTGAVASPPLKVPHHSSQQPIVTGASSSRISLPKPQVPGVHLGPLSKGLMDPPKVEVSMGGCIVVPNASPQQRGQVMQAGLPVPAYEASLGDVVQRVGFSHNMHDLASHYVHHPQLMYQQYLRAQQEALGAHIPPYHLLGAVRSPIVPGLDPKPDADAEDVRASSPPLELRRPASGGTSLGARGGGGMAPHSLQSPHDRATDSPQVAQVYVHGNRLPHYPSQPQRFYEPGPGPAAEPPPAHLRPGRHHPMPGTEAPANQQRLQVATPPHASQVPPQADSLLMLLQRYPVMWQGLLALKNDQAAVQMHFVFGNPCVARDSLPCNSDGSTPPLRIAQRMRLEQTQVDGVARMMQMDNEHCMLLALPCGLDHMDVLQQSNNLQTGFITYLQQKQAAGIVNIAAPGSQQAAYVVHIFPSCDFANENLARIAPDLLHRVAEIAHLLIIIATV